MDALRLAEMLRLRIGQWPYVAGVAPGADTIPDCATELNADAICEFMSKELYDGGVVNMKGMPAQQFAMMAELLGFHCSAVGHLDGWELPDNASSVALWVYNGDSIEDAQR